MIRNRLREILDGQEMTLYRLSEETGISYDNLAGHYYDTAAMIRHQTLERICRTLKCNPGDLLILVPPNQLTEGEQGSV